MRRAQLVQSSQDHGVEMLLDHQVVPQIEPGWLNTAVKHFEWICEVRSIVRRWPRVRNIHGHAMTASRATCPLPVVRRQGWHVAHQNRVKRSYVDAEFQCRRAHKDVDTVPVTLEVA